MTSGSQESEFRSQNPEVRMRTPEARFEDLVVECGDKSEFSQLLEEIGKLLEAYSQAILNSDFWILST